MNVVMSCDSPANWSRAGSFYEFPDKMLLFLELERVSYFILF